MAYWGTCILGKTEQETKELTLKWMARWANTIARDLLTLRSVLVRIGGYGSHQFDYDNESREELIARLDAKNAILSGLVNSLDRYYQDDERKSLLPTLVKEFGDIKSMCDGLQPFKTVDMEDESVYDYLSRHDGETEVSQFCVVKVDGNRDFFGRCKDVVSYLRERIEKRLATKNDKRVVLLFNDADTVDFLCCYREYAMTELMDEYPGLMVLTYDKHLIEKNNLLNKTQHSDSVKEK